jgi:hypothetical protein
VKKRWIAIAAAWRTRATAPKVLVRGRRCATSRRNSSGVLLRLDRVGLRVVDEADTDHLVGLDLERLALALALHERAARDQRAPAVRRCTSDA